MSFSRGKIFQLFSNYSSWLYLHNYMHCSCLVFLFFFFKTVKAMKSFQETTCTTAVVEWLFLALEFKFEPLPFVLFFLGSSRPKLRLHMTVEFTDASSGDKGCSTALNLFDYVISIMAFFLFFFLFVYVCVWKREREREREREIYRQTDIQTDKHTDRQIDPERDREREIERDRDRERQREIERGTERDRERETETERQRQRQRVKRSFMVLWFGIMLRLFFFLHLEQLFPMNLSNYSSFSPPIS